MIRLRAVTCVHGANARLTAALSLVLLVLPGGAASAQTIDDGFMISKHGLLVGDTYSHDSWDEYWEGTLKRDNGNIGTLTTHTNVWFADYGVTDRLNIFTAVPHVWTRASQGVLQGMQGFQDITVAAKYNVLDKPSAPIGSLRAIAVGVAGLPLTDYTPDFQPLSIGSASKRASGRFTLDVQTTPGWYVTGSTAYTWRAGVTLDRPFYYTTGQLFLTDEVDMPNVFEYGANAGYMKGRLKTGFTFAQQRTLGGGDIRRQDMPFVSNRMNFEKIGGMLMTPIPRLRDIEFQFAYAYTINGRNVGQATTVTTGLMYRLPFGGRPAQ